MNAENRKFDSLRNQRRFGHFEGICVYLRLSAAQNSFLGLIMESSQK
jgi:hypothetical protein